MESASTPLPDKSEQQSAPSRASFLRLIWIRRWRVLVLAALGAVVAVNAMAYRHAWMMTHLSGTGIRTANPESLSFAGKLWIAVVGVNLPKPLNQIDPSHVSLAYETRKFSGETGPQLEAWYVPHASAKGVVLLTHGYGGCKATLLHEARAFHDLGYAAFLLDFRGSGGSAGDVTTIGVNEADDVVSAIRYLRSQVSIRPLILYGQSMGSAAILRAFAIHQIEADAAILECPFDSLLSTAENRFHAMRMPGFPLAHLLIFWGGVQNGFNGFQHNPVDYAKSVHVPVLLLQGGKDPRVTVEQARAIYENLPGRKQFVLCPHAGHEAILAASPDLWKRSVADFLLSIQTR